MTKFRLILLIVCFSAFTLLAQAATSVPENDRIRIAEAFRIAAKLQNQLWENWDKAPFALLLITNAEEFLINHPKPSDEFQSIGYDKLLKSEVFVRPRKFQKYFLATFPAFNQMPVIVVGQAENTSVKTSTPWVFTVLHEHFHQLQMSQSTYFIDVNALNLARGDETGMWQLNFPFPYKNKDTAENFKGLSNSLLTTFDSRNRQSLKKTTAEYLLARQNFAKLLSEDDYKYFSFQLWQEGIARYTEYRMAEIAARKLKTGKEFQKLKDFTSFKTEAKNLHKGIVKEMQNADLTVAERLVFYPFGAIEGLLLDKVKPGWREKYFDRKFALERLY